MSRYLLHMSRYLYQMSRYPSQMSQMSRCPLGNPNWVPVWGGTWGGTWGGIDFDIWFGVATQTRKVVGFPKKKMADIRGYVQTEAPFQRGCVARLDASFATPHSAGGSQGRTAAGQEVVGTGAAVAMAHSSANVAG